MDCVFCKIVDSKLPSYKIYEDGSFFAFLDIKPLNAGHVLVIPKKHYRWVWDVENIKKYFEIVAKIAIAMKKAYGTEYVASLILGGDVPHAHVHLIPRFEGDGHGEGMDLRNNKELSEEEMKNAAQSIVDQL